MLTPTWESFPVALFVTLAVHVADGTEVDETVVVVGLAVVTGWVVGDGDDAVELEAAPGRH